MLQRVVHILKELTKMFSHATDDRSEKMEMEGLMLVWLAAGIACVMTRLLWGRIDPVAKPNTGHLCVYQFVTDVIFYSSVL